MSNNFIYLALYISLLISQWDKVVVNIANSVRLVAGSVEKFVNQQKFCKMLISGERRK